MSNQSIMGNNIVEKFRNNLSYCLSRIGGSDTILLEYYCKCKNRYNNDMNEVKRHFLSNNHEIRNMVEIVKKYNGYYGETVDELLKYCEMICESLRRVDESIYLYPMDVIGDEGIPYHNKSLYDSKFSNIFKQINRKPSDFTISYGIVESIDIFLPILNEIIKNKRVLVVSPFTESIKRQVGKEYFTEQRRLEGYKELMYYTTPITYETKYDNRTNDRMNDRMKNRTNNETNNETNKYPDESWVKTSERMMREIEELNEKTPYDIVLLACGSYANPLIGQVKKMKRQAIYMGGMLQIYFGLIGNRWLQDNPVARHVCKSLKVTAMIRPDPPSFVNTWYMKEGVETDLISKNAPEGYKAYF